MKKPLIIFDCDGVLVDSERISLEVLRQTIRRDGLSLTFDKCRDLFMGRSMASCLQIIESRLKRKLPKDYFDQFHNRVFDEFKRSLEPTKDILTTLANLKKEGFHFCVASSGSYEKMNISLPKCGLDKIFSNNIYSADDVKRGKPFPDLFQYAARKMNYNSDDCIVVEDSLPGIQAAKDAGMKVVYFCPEEPIEEALAWADALCQEMINLPKIINKLF